MAADWFDIDYSAFAYDRDFEEDLCIDDFTVDFMTPAPGLTRNAGPDFPASEAWCASALLHPTSVASNQYAEFFAHEPGAADARVAGDVIDPAGVPLQIPAYRLWSGAKRDDRHGKHAPPERQHQTRKRALQRARRRAAAVGGTWYRNRWVTCQDIGAPGESHNARHHIPARSPGTFKQQMPKLPCWPPKPAAAGYQGSQSPCMPKRGLGVLSFNLGGFTKAGFDEFQRWLHLDTTKRLVHVVFLQETWRGSNEFCTKDWVWVQSGRSPVAGQGVAILLNRRFADSASIRFAERRVGRVLMVLVPALRGHPLRRRPTTLISVYQYARSSEQAEVYANRAKIWTLLHQVVAAVPRRHLLIVAGDMNTPVQPNGHLVGRGVLPPRVVPQDEDQLAQLLEAHSLVALNTFGQGGRCAATFCGQEVWTQLDYVIVRSSQVGPLGRQAMPQAQLEFFQWREGPRHLPVYATVLDTCPEFSSPAAPQHQAPKVDRNRMAQAAQQDPLKVQRFRTCVKEALAVSTSPVSPEHVDDILTQVSEQIFASKPEATLPCAWQSPETAVCLQDVWALRAEHMALAKQVRIACLCMPERSLRSLWVFWVQHTRYDRARKRLRRNSQQQRKARWVRQLENAEQALARHDSHAFYAAIHQLAPKQARGRIQLKGSHGEMLTAEAEVDRLYAYWHEIFHDGTQVCDPVLHEGIQVTLSEVCAAIAQLPVRKAVMPGRAHSIAWKLAAEEVAPYVCEYVQAAWAVGPISIPLYLTEAWLHFMSKPGRTLRTPGDLRPLALQSAGGKALSRLLKTRLTPFAERVAHCTPQFAYLRNRDTQSAIARALIHIDKVRSRTLGGQRLSIHAKKAGVQQQRCAGGATLSLDLSRAFDSVGHAALWEALMWAEVPHDLATLLLSWYHSEYALGQRNGGYTRRISITKGVKQGCIIAPTVWVILSCYVHHRLDAALSDHWSAQHATCFADDFLFQWELESFKACKVMCNDVGVIFDVFASLDLCINSNKSAILLRLVGPEAEAWMVKHRFPAPEGFEAKHVLRYDKHKKRELQIKTTHVYLGIVLTYDAYEEATMRHRLRLAAVHKHRLARILQGRGGLTKQQRLRLWRVAIATSMMYATHVVGLTQASLRSLHVMMVRHLRAIMQSPRHLTQEADLAFLQRISQDTPLQMVLKALGSMLTRIALPSDFPCYAAVDIQHRLQALRGNMVALSEAPAERGCQLLAVPDNAPVFECQFCGQRFATLHMVKSHEGKMHKQHAPKQQLPDASHYAVGGVPTCRFCGESFSKWAHLKRHISLNRCAGLRLKSTTNEPAAAAPVGTVTPAPCPEVENMERASETLCQAEPPQVTLATELVPARVVSAIAPVQSLLPTSPKAGPSFATSVTADNAMPTHLSERTTDLNPSVWTSVQQTKDHNRALPVAEWSAVRAAGNLENIVKVQGVKEIIKQTCCVCGQWIAATNGVRKHLRDAHPDIWKPHESTIKHRAKLWSKSAFSPCTLCAAVVAEPRKHPACCIVFAQACLLELLNRAATGDDRPADGGHAGDGAVRTCPHTPTGTNGGGTGGTADGSGHHAQATATIQTAASAQGQREGRRQSTGGQKSRSLQQFFGQGSSSSAKQGRATASRSATPPRMRHRILLGPSDSPGSRHGHSDHVQCSRALAEAASRESGTSHLLTGHHDVSLSTTGAEQSSMPCSEIEGGSGWSGQAGDDHRQAGLEVHDLGQGQWETGARRHSQPHDHQGSAEISAGGRKLVAELARDDYQVLQHSEAPPGDHQCDDPLPDRCHAEGRSHVPDSASMVPAECLASAERALAPGSGQAHTSRDQDSESAQSYVLGLQLRNDANQCYANSLVLALAWTVQRHGGPTAVSLQALLLKLQRARAGQPLMLRKLQEWRPFAQGWLRPLQQHDVAELFMHMCKRAQGFPDCCRWTVQRVAADGVPAEPGGDGPILMQLRHTNGTAHATLQDCFEGWHEQLHLYAIDGARPMLVVQLSRFVGHGIFCTKDTAEISLGSGVVHVPCIAARDVTHVPYRVVAAIIHIGASPMSGHYRAVLLSPGSEGAGALEGARITDDNTRPVPLCHADQFGRRVYLLFLTRVDA